MKVWQIVRVENGSIWSLCNPAGEPRVQMRRGVPVRNVSVWVSEFGGYDFPSGTKIILRHGARSIPPSTIPEPFVEARAA